MTTAPKTKKMLVAFDPANPEKSSSDFLSPVFNNGEIVFFGTKSKQCLALGMVVFVGVEVTINDLFARLVDSGRIIPCVAETLTLISTYLSQVSVLGIGQVVQITADASGKGFSLKVVPVPKRENKRHLP